jgi:hypothetical protein
MHLPYAGSPRHDPQDVTRHPIPGASHCGIPFP